MDLLKEGVKTLSQRLNSSMELNPVDIPPSKASSTCKRNNDRCTKQMLLNNNLELLGVDKAIKVKYSYASADKIASADAINIRITFEAE